MLHMGSPICGVRIKMSKQLMIKPEKCTGCRTCELMCSFGHTQKFNPRHSAVTVFAYDEAAVSIPVMCLQCDEAPCVKVCPVGAMTRDEKGVVGVNPNKCIVCKMCVSACPLGNISYSPVLAKVVKCDECFGEPKCAKFCPSGAINYVDAHAGPERKGMVAENFKEVFGEEGAK